MSEEKKINTKKCPACDGRGATWYNEPAERDECRMCNGTGQIPEVDYEGE